MRETHTFSDEIRAISAFGIKGGCGKSTLTLLLAAGIKRIFPGKKVGLIDMTTEQATLSAVFAPELEARGQGIWKIVKASMDEPERELNPNLVRDTILAAVVPLMVLPDAPAEAAGTIEFIGCGKRQLPAVEGHKDLLGADAARIGGRVLQEIRETLGWDWAILDLPPTTKDVGSRMMLGCCSAVAVTAMLAHRDDLTGYPSMIEGVRHLGVEPAGWVLNKHIPGDRYSEVALAEVESLSKALAVPILGLLRERQTVKSSREPYAWAGKTAKTAVGLYVAQGDTRLNGTTREGIAHTIHEVEAVAHAVLEAVARAEARQAQEV